MRAGGLLPLVVYALMGAGLPSGAVAGGAPTIAAAPLIPVGQAQVNAVAGIDYWRVKLREGDHLTLQYGPQKQFRWAEICLYRPDVSDQTVATERCYAGGQTLTGSSLTISARPAGTWTIAVRPYPGCSSSGITSSSCISALVAYTLTATVQHETSTHVAAMNLARAGQLIRVSGSLHGVRGRLLLEGSWDGGANWTTLGIAAVDGHGRFSYPVRLRQKGSLEIRASYPETPQYAGSSATVVVRVV